MTKDIINQSVSKVDSILLMLIVLYSAFRSTIFPQVIGTSDRVLVILILILLVCFAIHFFAADKTEKIIFLKNNSIVIIYLAIRTISLVIGGFNTYTLGSIMYETTFLLLISEWAVGRTDNVKKILKAFVVFNFVVNVLSFFSGIFNEELFLLGVDLTVFHDNIDFIWVYPYASLYMNPNTAGIMTALSLVCFIVLITSNKISFVLTKKTVGIVIYILFTAFMMYQYECRSAFASIIGVVAIYIICTVFKWDKRNITQTVLLIVVLSNLSLVGYMHINNSSTVSEESLLNKASSGRYEIWTDCYNTANYAQSWILGHGSNEQELEKRNTYLKQQWVNDGQDEALYVEETLGIHNGFLGVLFNSGVICFLLFAIIMHKKTEKIQHFKGNWYLIVIFTLIVNNFESVLIMNKFYTCFLMMIVLAMDTTKDNQIIGEKNES